MTARRSEDPAARELSDGVGSAAAYWTAQRRHAARPAPFERDLSADSPGAAHGDEAESQESRESGLGVTKDGATCVDGVQPAERDD